MISPATEWIYVEYAFLHDVNLVLTDGFVACDNLTVQIGKGNFVAVYQIKIKDSAPCKCLDNMTAHNFILIHD